MNTLLWTSLAASALAQNARIGLPEAGHSIKAGHELTVQVQRPVRFATLFPLSSPSATASE